MVDGLIQLLVSACAVSALSILVTRSTLTWQMRIDLLKTHPMLGKLLGCPFCLSWWFALTPAAFLDTFFKTAIPGGWILLTWPAVVGLSSIVTGLIYQLMMHPEHEVEKMRQVLIDIQKDLKGDEATRTD